HEAMRLILWLEKRMDQLIDAGRLDERFHPPHSSIHVGLVNGGIAPNVIADKAHFYWDLRTIPMDKTETIVNEFKTYCSEREQKLQQRFPGFKIKTIENHPPVVHLDTKETDAIVGLVRRISGNSKLNTVAYAAEAGQFAAEGFQSAICGPGSIAQAHRADEFIAKDELVKGMEMMNNLITEMSSFYFE
ncbi:MAG: M20/M25/M40 family metallo-hydrolase, partial [Maribacter sp.]|nr:M20/M25/M40 family metallo-hydrolase [Maribacter sp.]